MVGGPRSSALGLVPDPHSLFPRAQDVPVSPSPSPSTHSAGPVFESPLQIEVRGLEVSLDVPEDGEDGRDPYEFLVPSSAGESDDEWEIPIRVILKDGWDTDARIHLPPSTSVFPLTLSPPPLHGPLPCYRQIQPVLGYWASRPSQSFIDLLSPPLASPGQRGFTPPLYPEGNKVSEAERPLVGRRRQSAPENVTNHTRAAVMNRNHSFEDERWTFGDMERRDSLGGQRRTLSLGADRRASMRHRLESLATDTAQSKHVYRWNDGPSNTRRLDWAAGRYGMTRGEVELNRPPVPTSSSRACFSVSDNGVGAWCAAHVSAHSTLERWEQDETSPSAPWTELRHRSSLVPSGPSSPSSSDPLSVASSAPSARRAPVFSFASRPERQEEEGHQCRMPYCHPSGQSQRRSQSIHAPTCVSAPSYADAQRRKLSPTVQLDSSPTLPPTFFCFEPGILLDTTQPVSPTCSPTSAPIVCFPPTPALTPSPCESLSDQPPRPSTPSAIGSKANRGTKGAVDRSYTSPRADRGEETPSASLGDRSPPPSTLTTLPLPFVLPLIVAQPLPEPPERSRQGSDSSLPPLLPTSEDVILRRQQRPHVSQAQGDQGRSMPYGDQRPGAEHTRNSGWAAHQDCRVETGHPFALQSNSSVPSSTRSISTASGSTNPITPPDSTPSAPSSFSHAASRRYSKFTALSASSSASSISSNDSLCLRGPERYWTGREHPDISTVFEEDNSIEVHLSEKTDEAGQRTAAQAVHTHQQPKESASRGPLPSFAQTSKDRCPTVPSVSSLSSYSSDKTRLRTRNERSYAYSATDPGHSGKPANRVHPFANVVIRSASPSLPCADTKDNLFLSGRGLPPSMAKSKSHADFAETYSMTSAIAVRPHQGLVSTEDSKDEDSCPVCVESLSFTFRLPGEKPHIVPECGHALHEECFVTVYGQVPRDGSRRNIGVCGVCRQPMRIGDGGCRKGLGGNKLVNLLGEDRDAPPPNLAHAASKPSLRSRPSRVIVPSPAPLVDPRGDDPLETNSLSTSGSSQSLITTDSELVVPSISIQSEHGSIHRGQSRKGKQAITAMVTVEIPHCTERGKYSARRRPPPTSMSGSGDQVSPGLPSSPRSDISYNEATGIPASARSMPISTPDSFAHVLVDLKNRVHDFKTSGLDALGALRLFDLLSVRKAQLVREFHVYLFQKALICVSEEKKSGFKNIFSSGSSIRSADSGLSANRGVLKLKGRIYMRHVRRIIDTSTPSELSLTITMEDEAMDSFILTFRDRGSHETWRANLSSLLEETKPGGPGSQSAAKLAKIMGPGVPTNSSVSGKPFSPSSAGSGFPTGNSQSFGDLYPPSTGGQIPSSSSSSFSPTSPNMSFKRSAGDLAFDQPLAPVHTSLDLVIMISTPVSNSAGAHQMKNRLMKESLACVLALLGPRDRVCLVAAEMGNNGTVRQTPLLNSTKYESRKRLEHFVEVLGSGRTEGDEFEVKVHRDERFDVVTAVNIALDVVLGRKQRNQITGMIMISDTSDIIKRQQMELVSARLDAANTPVHTLGFGKAHDPSPLWMISNYTNGTYTYVRDWYHLRNSLAGVVGGLMTIALTNLKLHLNCQDNDFKVTKVAGTPQAIVAHNGKSVDIDLREVRHGEIREIMVELDFVNPSEGSEQQRNSSDGSDESEPHGERSNASSQVASSVRKAPSSTAERSARGLGLDTLSVNDANALRDVVYEDASIDEVPVTEVDCSFHDPACGRSVSRLPHPVLLTTALLPSNAPASSSPSDPTVVRRRMELLAADMITRALLIASRKNFNHAERILKETRKIIEKMAEQFRRTLQASGGVAGRTKRETQMAAALEGLAWTINDVDLLLEGLEEHRDTFERDHRNYAAQQAIVLRIQRSSTTRTPSERQYCPRDIQNIVQISSEWSSRS